MANEAMPEAGLPFDPFGSAAGDRDGEARGRRLVAGSGLTVLVGGVVSISHEVEMRAGARVAVLVLDTRRR